MATKFQHYITDDSAGPAVYGDTLYGQQFTVSIAHSIEFVILKLNKEGTPPGNLIIEIQEVDGSNLPNGVVLCSGDIVADSLSVGFGEWQQIDFSVPADLEASKMYAIVAYLENYGGDGANVVDWRADLGSALLYPGGIMVRSFDRGVSWEGLTSHDFMFEEWGTGLAIKVPMIKENWGW